MADMTAPTGQAPTMAPPVRTNDQFCHASDGCKLGFGNPNTGSVTSFGTIISFTDAFSTSPSDKILESHDTLEDRKELLQPG
nr:hypothetical protein [Tanacetum cinerariifolium]